MEKDERISYADNNIGSGKYCECGRELSKDEYYSQYNKSYKNKLCRKCMNDYCDHAIEGV